MSEKKTKLFGEPVIKSFDNLDDDYDLDSNGLNIDPNDESIFDYNDKEPIDEEDLYKEIPLDENSLFTVEPLKAGNNSDTDTQTFEPYENFFEKESVYTPGESEKKTTNFNGENPTQTKSVQPENTPSTIDPGTFIETEWYSQPLKETQEKTNQEKTVPKEKKKGKLAKYIIGFIILVICAAFLGYGIAYMATGKKETEPTPVQTPQRAKQSEEIYEDEDEDSDTYTSPSNSGSSSGSSNSQRKSSSPSNSGGSNQVITPTQPTEPSTETEGSESTPTNPIIEDAPVENEPMDYDLMPPAETDEYIPDYYQPDYENSPYSRDSGSENVVPQSNFTDGTETSPVSEEGSSADSNTQSPNNTQSPDSTTSEDTPASSARVE